MTSATGPKPPKRGGFFSLFSLPPTTYKESVLKELGRVMASFPQPGDNRIDAGYVYLGQFLVHDISRLKKPTGWYTPVDELIQLNSPSLDLSCVYGNGFADSSVAVDTRTGKLQLGRLTTEGGLSDGPAGDLPRRKNKTAIIPDDRNDENLLVAQLHVQFLKLHNFFVKKLSSDDPDLNPQQLFDKARELLTLHFQEVVLFDLLDTIVDPRIWESAVRARELVLWKPEPGERARMPIELSAAALRFGHSMIRPTYSVNSDTSVNRRQLFEFTGKGTLGGANTLPESHRVDWRQFFRSSCAPKPRFFQHAMLIRPFVDMMIPARLQGAASVPVAVKNLLTGNMCGLPDAQAVVHNLLERPEGLAESIGLRLLTREELDPIGFRMKKGLLSSVSQAHGFFEKTPLWYYALAESNAFHGGTRLGPMASLIVAESLAGLVQVSEPTIFSESWILGSSRREYIAPTKRMHGNTYFQMTDLLEAVR